jgi:enoyl-CoA hydratase/carnithine racemase
LYDEQDEILTSTLNNSVRLNACSRQMLDDVHAAFDHADADDSISAVLASMNRALALVCLMINSAKKLAQKFMSPEP